MPDDLSIAEPLVDHYLDLYVEEVWAGNADWVQYRRVATEVALMSVRAAREAARRMGITIHADIVPEDYTGAPVKAQRGQVVLRVGEGPAPWERS
jgi:hypothetical protein